MYRLIFVPRHKPCNQEYVDKLQEFVENSKKLLVLTGAGISTESGIPDYRSEGVGLYARSKTRPIIFKDFLNCCEARQRYWARNFVGWPRFSSFTPNINHQCLADWEHKGKVQCIVTQNVDRLHHKAGSKYIVELHGSSYQVICISCSYMKSRHLFQEDLTSLNGHTTLKPGEIRPDGDIELTKDEVKHFKVPACPRCDGILKPNIVFFGDNVPGIRVNKVKEELASCDSLLALGTSFSVFSALRFILLASELHIPIAIVNIGETRGDRFASLKLPVKCGDIIPQIVVKESQKTYQKTR